MFVSNVDYILYFGILLWSFDSVTVSSETSTIFGSKRTYANKRALAGIYTTVEFTGTFQNRAECAARCSLCEKCNSYNYRSENRLCECLSTNAAAEPSEYLTADGGWKFFRLKSRTINYQTNIGYPVCTAGSDVMGPVCMESCPPGYEAVAKSDDPGVANCYKIHNEGLGVTYDEAEGICESEGSKLVEIKSDEQLGELQSHLAKFSKESVIPDGMMGPGWTFQQANTDSYVRMIIAEKLYNELSIVCWFRLFTVDGAPVTTEPHLVNYFQGSTNKVALSYDVAASTFKVMINNNVPTPSTNQTINLSDAWHHVGLTWTKFEREVKVYVDNSLYYSGTVPNGNYIGSGGMFIVGHKQDAADSNTAFVGQMKDLQISSGVITDDNLTAIYNARGRKSICLDVVGCATSKNSIIIGTHIIMDTMFRHYNIGCFVDKGERDFSYNLMPMSGGVSNEKCYDTCFALGYKYFATQAGSHCHCGDTYGSYGEADPNNCLSYCTNYYGKCGGAWRNSVFGIADSLSSYWVGALTAINESSTRLIWPSTCQEVALIDYMKYVGCFIDNGIRDLHVQVYYSAGNTPELCEEACREVGYLYSGTQSANQCFCGNSYGYRGHTVDSECATNCVGDIGQKCGGTWRNSVRRVLTTNSSTIASVEYRLYLDVEAHYAVREKHHKIGYICEYPISKC